MICLTGDVHHSSFNSDDLHFCKGSEVDAALRMAEIASDFHLKVTLFCTGKCAEEQPAQMKQLACLPNVEVGGHNYFAFKPRWPFKYYHRLTGRRNGPYIYQWWEVWHTKRVLQKVCGSEVLSWRDHAYRHDRNTRKILQAHGIKYFSDLLSKDGGQPVHREGVIDIPINTLPDHDYVYHGNRQPDTVDPQALLATHFSTPPMDKEAWLQQVTEEVAAISAKNGVTTILAHPACMEVFDDFQTFEKLCKFLQSYSSCLMKNLADYVVI